MTPAVRLRQVALMTSDLAGTTARLETELGLGPSFRDEGVGYFGLENRVLEAGDCFIVVLTPLDEGSAGRRFLTRRGADGGYMAIFQFADRAAPRALAAELEARIVWQADLPDISGTHLDPRDVPGAIVSLDWAAPPESWHWAGPAWQGGAPAHAKLGGIRSLEVGVTDPPAAAARWGAALGPGAEVLGTEVLLGEAGQVLSFVTTADRSRQAITACGLDCAGSAPAAPSGTTIGGVRFTVVPAATAADHAEEEP